MSETTAGISEDNIWVLSVEKDSNDGDFSEFVMTALKFFGDLKNGNLNLTEVRVLFALLEKVKKGGVTRISTQAEIGKGLKLDRHRVSKAIKSLEQQEFFKKRKTVLGWEFTLNPEYFRKPKDKKPDLKPVHLKRVK